MKKEKKPAIIEESKQAGCLEDRTCEECGEVFKPDTVTQMLCDSCLDQFDEDFEED
jgi:formylmethanofuran dehydrogenase subunit E